MLNEKKVIINKEFLFNLFKDGIDESKSIILGLFGDADDEVSEAFYKDIGTHIDSIYKKILEEAKPVKIIKEDHLKETMDEFWGEKDGS